MGERRRERTIRVGSPKERFLVGGDAEVIVVKDEEEAQVERYQDCGKALWAE